MWHKGLNHLLGHQHPKESHWLHGLEAKKRWSKYFNFCHPNVRLLWNPWLNHSWDDLKLAARNNFWVSPVSTGFQHLEQSGSWIRCRAAVTQTWLKSHERRCCKRRIILAQHSGQPLVCIFLRNMQPSPPPKHLLFILKIIYLTGKSDLQRDPQMWSQCVLDGIQPSSHRAEPFQSKPMLAKSMDVEAWDIQSPLYPAWKVLARLLLLFLVENQT